MSSLRCPLRSGRGAVALIASRMLPDQPGLHAFHYTPSLPYRSGALFSTSAINCRRESTPSFANARFA